MPRTISRRRKISHQISDHAGRSVVTPWKRTVPSRLGWSAIMTWKSGPFSWFFKLLRVHCKNMRHPTCHVYSKANHLIEIFIEIKPKVYFGKTATQKHCPPATKCLCLFNRLKIYLNSLNQCLFTKSTEWTNLFPLIFSLGVAELKAIFCRSVVDAIRPTCFKWHAWSTSVHCKIHQTYPPPPYCYHNMTQNQHYKCFIEAMK